MSAQPAPVPTTDPTQATDPTQVAPVTNIGNAVNGVVKAAPELQQSPGLVVGVANSGGDTSGRAQAVAHATNTIADQNAKQSVSESIGGDVGDALGFLGHAGSDVLGAVKTAGEDVMKVANKPMATVQHEYRYLHDVEASHGRMAAVEEGLGLAAGAIVGGIITGGSPFGVEAGAELAGYAEGEASQAGLLGPSYKESWDRTSDGNTYTDPHTHQPVSLGRDIASFIGLSPGTTTYRLSSGLIDGIFDMNVGGTETLGLVGEARSAEGLSGVLASKWGGTAIHTLGDAVDGPGVTEASEIDRIYDQYPSVRAAFRDIAGKTAGELSVTPAYRALAPIFTQLGEAETPEAVGQVFKEVMRTHELSMTDRLPSLSWTRLHFGQALREAVGGIGAPAAEDMPAQLAAGATSDERVRRLNDLFATTGSPNDISKLNPLGYAARQSQRFTQLPVSYDDVSKTMKLGEFDPSNLTDDGTNAVVQQARYTESDRVAASIGDLYHNAPDLATKVRIFRQLTLNQLFSLAGYRGLSRDEYLDAWELANPGTRGEMSKALADAVGGGMFGKEAVYGLNDQGDPISLVRDAEGEWQYGAGIWENQTGRLHTLKLDEARRAAKMLRGARDVLGQIDTSLYNRITQGIFKPLVLLTPSYAEHIALAEIIPNALREGVFKLARSGIEANIAKLGMRVGDLGSDDPDHVSALAGLAWRMVMAGRKVLPARMDNALESDLQLAAREIEYNGGTITAAGVDSGHAYEAEVANRETQTTGLLRRAYYDEPIKGPTSRTFGTIGRTDDQYMPAWQRQLAEIARDPAGQLAAKEMIAGANRGEDIETASENATKEVARYLRDPAQAGRASRFLRSNDAITMAPIGQTRLADQDAFDEHAAAMVHALRGAVRGADRSIDGRLLGAIAEGRTMTEQELADIPEVARPVLVKGRELLPATSGKVQEIANVGFRRVLNPMVNFLSRQPIFWNEFKRQWALVEPMVDKGYLDEDEAMSLANDRAVNRVLRNIHNLTDRTQWTVTLRNWAPFYFAQEQAYRRMGRLLAENPRAFRQYQLMISNIGNLGQIFQGKDGQGYFVLPGSGFLTSGSGGAGLEAAGAGAILGGAAAGPVGAAVGAGAAGLGVVGIFSKLGIPFSTSSPIGMGWNLSASSVIFPLSAGVRPDLGPLVAVGTDGLASIFNAFLDPQLKSDLSATTNAILGPDAAEKWYEQVIPNTIVQRLLTAAIPSFDQRSFYSTQMNALATLDFENRIPSPALAASNPWALQQFLDRWQSMTSISYIAKALVGAITPVSPEATVPTYNLFDTQLSNDINSTGSINKGLTKFLSENPDAQPFTAFQSTSDTGVTVPSSVAAETWINENMGIIQSSGGAALLLMPQNINATYNAAVYNEQIAQGLRTKWFPGEELPNGQLEGYLQQLYVNAGNAIVLDKWYPQYEKALNGTTGTERSDLETNWQTTINNYSALNPIWGDYWREDASTTIGGGKRGQLINNMKKLLASPEAPRTEVADMTRTLISAYEAYESTYGSNQLAGESNTDLTSTWQANLYATVAAHPELTNVVTGLFLSLPSTAPVPASAPGESNENQGIFTAKNWRAA